MEIFQDMITQLRFLMSQKKRKKSLKLIKKMKPNQLRRRFQLRKRKRRKPKRKPRRKRRKQ